MTYARKILIPKGSPGTFHCVSRCVRRAFLGGEDRLTGRSFEHRRQWVEDRIHELAGIFGVAIWGYAVMSNHLHVVTTTDTHKSEFSYKSSGTFPTKPKVWTHRQRATGRKPSSLSDLKEIGCKSAWTVHISLLFWAIEELLPCKIIKIWPRPVRFSLRFFKSDRLLGLDALHLEHPGFRVIQVSWVA